MLVLEGGPAERGRQHGQALRPAVPAATVTMDVACGPPDEAPWLELAR